MGKLAQESRQNMVVRKENRLTQVIAGDLPLETFSAASDIMRKTAKPAQFISTLSAACHCLIDVRLCDSW